MTVHVNQQTLEVPEHCSLEHLLELLQVPARGIAIAIAQEVVPRSNWQQTIQEGQHITIIKATQGG